MIRFVALCVVVSAGCRLGPSTFHCANDSECDTAANGRCISGACAFPTSPASCASGFAFDRSAGARANACVPVAAGADLGRAPVADLGLHGGADLSPARADDLSPPLTYDMTAPPDLSCMPGAQCVPVAAPPGARLVGACTAGTLACGGGAPVCVADFDGNFRSVPAPNGSFDWSCDGTVEPELTNLAVAPAVQLQNSWCTTLNSAQCCNNPAQGNNNCGATPHYFTRDNATPACGASVVTFTCSWDKTVATCFASGGAMATPDTTTTVQRCR